MTHDLLTGLLNRSEIIAQGKALEHQSASHALLHIDIDHFKIINDRYGHGAGDDVLEQLARLLEDCSDASGLLARVGDDEFALILKNCSEAEALREAKSIHQCISESPFKLEDRSYDLTVSMGIAIFGMQGKVSMIRALGLADAACFLAKEKGRNRIQVNHPDDEDVSQQQLDMEWVGIIKDCIREGRLVLHTQRFTALHPQPDEKHISQEVLARLLDEEGGLIAPGLFIPAAERFGLIEQLDRRIVDMAFASLQALEPEERSQSRYFINISGITLSNESFSAFMDELVLRYPDVEADNVCFEITETVEIAKFSNTLDTIRSLYNKGFKLALDDFGTGVASFAYLQKLPLHYLKIDGSFIRGLEDSETGKVIVESIARVALSMGLKTIAESVEDAEVMPILKKSGIDYAQGFALHEPELLQTRCNNRSQTYVGAE